MEKTTKKQGYYSSAPWEDNYGSTADTDSGQDAFEDYPVNSSRRALNFLLLLKLIYAGIIFSTMVANFGINSRDDISVNLFCFIIIAMSICIKDFLFRFKLIKSNSIYGTKTYIIMGVYIVLTLFCFFLRYNHLIKDDDMLLILVLTNLSNEGLAFIDCLNMEQKNYVKLSGLNYIWMILMPVLLMSRNYINLSFWYTYTTIIIVLDAIMGSFIEYVSVMCWIVYY